MRPYSHNVRRYLSDVSQVRNLAAVPNQAAVYAMYGKAGRRPAYVGIAGKLRSRLRQHLVLRDSSVTTGSSLVALNPEAVRIVSWWQHPGFDDKTTREAAELVAFDILDPVLRSRGAVSQAAERLAREQDFGEEMKVLFEGEPAGRYLVPTLADLIERVESLETRLAADGDR